MMLISPLLKHVVYPALARTGYLRHRAAHGTLAIVTYHGVIPPAYRSLDAHLDGSLVTAELLRRQLRLLKSQYNVISPEDFLARCDQREELPPRAVLLTCDDSLRNVLTDMLPALHQEKLKCLFFVTANSITGPPGMLWYEELYLMLLATPENIALDFPELDIHVQANGQREKREFWWTLVRKLSQHEWIARRRLLQEIRMRLGLRDLWNVRYLNEVAYRSRFFRLDEAELKRLVAEGMSIGSRTASHPVLSEAATESAWHEIADSRVMLERTLGIAVWALAYPFGGPSAVTERETGMAERAGYCCAFIGGGGGFGADLPRYSLPCVHVPCDMTVGEFEAHISGLHRSLRQSFLMPG